VTGQGADRRQPLAGHQAARGQALADLAHHAVDKGQAHGCLDCTDEKSGQFHRIVPLCHWPSAAPPRTIVALPCGDTSMNGTLGGWFSGFLGILIFSGSLPATRVAVGTFEPTFLTLARASIAGLLAALILLALRQRRPQRRDLPALLVVALGVVIGFPLLTALALRHVSSAHAIVFVGLLPLATALFAVLRRRAATPGVLAVLRARQRGGRRLRADQGGGASLLGDLLMLAAILACGLGYAEGARLSRRLGSWQVICCGAGAAPDAAADPVDLAGQPDHGDLAGLAEPGLCVAVQHAHRLFLLYHGLARGGIAAVGQLQLLQPFFGLALAGLLLHEQVSPLMAGVAAAVLLCVAAARRFAR
jgi:drug/metabolite transporter (DMT)-like permease